ncbi:MAG: amidohydrolase/deacetylase family metallohydrolase [Alicyclobacillus sp.]|nr:amidohydrolase/deacetylase family metallohydrolase [Alicyclobacillus sp.]
MGMSPVEIGDGTRLKVLNPEEPNVRAGVLRVDGAGVRIEPVDDASGQTADPELFISPGWIDLHTHVLDGFTGLGVPADSVGLCTGVHMVVDAGSAGEATLGGFTKYVVPAAKTKIRAWLNISSIGLVHLREVSDLRYIDVDRTVKAIADNRPFVCGVKVRSSGAIVGNMGLQPLKLAKLCAREAGVPLMVHIGEAPPVIEDVLNELGPGDVVTHCFHGKLGHPWEVSGAPCGALERALDRGVLLDVGHGAASFAWHVALGAIKAGRAPFSISTDVHTQNIQGPVYDLPITMTKLLACGLTLEQVIAGVTSAPASILREQDWCDMNGVLRHATIFRVTSENVRGLEYRDSMGNPYEPTQHIVPVAVITEDGITKIES